MPEHKIQTRGSTRSESRIAVMLIPGKPDKLPDLDIPPFTHNPPSYNIVHYKFQALRAQIRFWYF